MARKPIAIGATTDYRGDPWDIESSEPTEFGFAIHRGRRSAGRDDVERRGGAAVIVTTELVSYLESRRADTINRIASDLKIGATLLKSIRREIGISRTADLAKWWDDRIEDLKSLTLEQFSEKHKVATHNVHRWRTLLVGKTLREPGWYLDASVLEALESSAPAADVATFLGGIAPGSVGRLRSNLERAGVIARGGTPGERIAASKRGIPAPEITKKILKRAAKKKKSPEHRRRIAMANARWHRENPGKALEHFGLRAWAPEEEAELGTATDREIAQRIDRTIPAVRARRQQLAIPAFRPGWSMPVPRSDIAKKLCSLIRSRYQSISGASRATKVAYRRLWDACEGRKAIKDTTLDKLLADIHATRSDLELP